MTQQLDHSWVKEIYTPEELKQYAQFEAEMKARSNPDAKALFVKNWQNLIEEIKQNQTINPKSEIGINLGKKCIELINGLYGKKYAHLRTKKFEQGFGKGKGLDEVGMTPEIVSWLEQALDAYWRERIYSLLAQAGQITAAELLSDWNIIMDDMYGDDNERKKAIAATALADTKISQDAKKWLKITFNL